MGRALAILLHQELASVVDEGVESEAELLGDRARRLNEREAALDDRERNLEQREGRIVSGGKPAATVQVESKLHPLEPAGVVPRAGRNDLCPCGSGLKYKRCHGA
jgi:preprotein translocase subunit SecA